MKNNIFLLSAVIFGLTACSSNNNELINHLPADSHEIEEEIIIEYLEDMAEFSSHDKLASFYGNEFVEKTQFDLENGSKASVSVLYAKTDYPIYFVWNNDNYSHLKAIEIHSEIKDPSFGHKETRPDFWAFRNGLKLKLNTSLMESLNGGTFDLKAVGSSANYVALLNPEKFQNYTVTLGFEKNASINDYNLDMAPSDSILSSSNGLLKNNMVVISVTYQPVSNGQND